MPIAARENNAYQGTGVGHVGTSIPYSLEQIRKFESEDLKMLLDRGVDETVAKEIAAESIAPLKEEMEKLHASLSRT